MLSHIPHWLQWLSYLLWPLVVISVLLVFGYLFSTITNLIAAPFCGLLAEQLEGHLTGKSLADTGIFSIVKDLPPRARMAQTGLLPTTRLLLSYHAPAALALYFIPGLGQTVAPILWFLFSALDASDSDSILRLSGSTTIRSAVPIS